VNTHVLQWVLRVARHGRMVPNGHHAELDLIARAALSQLRALKGDR